MTRQRCAIPHPHSKKLKANPSYLAQPKPDGADYGGVDAAYLNVRVNDPLEASAEAAARELVASVGWEIEELEDAYPLVEGHCEEGKAGRTYMAPALVDGICAVFHQWDISAA